MEIEYRLLDEDYEALIRYDVRSRKGIHRPARTGYQGWHGPQRSSLLGPLGYLGAALLYALPLVWLLFAMRYVFFEGAPAAPWAVFVSGVLAGVYGLLLALLGRRQWQIYCLPKAYAEAARRS